LQLLRDPERLELPIISAKAHNSIINAIDGYGPLNVESKSSEIITGSRDGRIKLWDLRTELSPITVVSPDQQAADIWSLAFANCGATERIFAAGYDNGDLKIFDQRSNSYIWGNNLGSGICSIEFSSMGSDSYVLAGSLNGYHIVNLQTGQVTNQKLDSTVWKIRHIPHQEDLYMTANGSGYLSLYRQDKPSSPIGESKQTEHPIISFDWNEEKSGLYAAVSFDQQVRVGMVDVK